MKRWIAALAALVVSGGAGAASVVTNTVTWSLPAAWADGVAYPRVEGYRAICGEDLQSRTGAGEVGEPDLPYYRIHVALPADGAFAGVTYEAAWEPVDLGGALPLPVARPVPTGGEVVYPAPGAAYGTVYPQAAAQAGFRQVASGVSLVPVLVTPFRWDGPAKTLYRAKALTVRATYTAPAARGRLSASARTELTDLQRMALAMAVNPSDGTPSPSRRLSAAEAHANLACYGEDSEADYVILSPHRFVDLWKAFAAFRKTTENGTNHTYCVVDTADIYREFDHVDGDDALKIHRYLERLYALAPCRIKYVLLGAVAKKYQYDRETMIPARYVVCGGSLSQMLDMYYGCMDRLPKDVGVEVWDYDGDGAYLGHRNANGSYSQDSNAYIDWMQDLVVFRFPLMERVVESGVALDAGQIITNFMRKVTRVERADYPDRYNAIYTGSTGFSTSTYGSVGRGEMYGLIVDEREFFDQGLNIFSPEHPSWASDSEFVPRDHGWEFLTYLRGNRRVRMNNSSYSTCPYQDLYRTSGDFLDTVCHGWARGAVGAVAAGEAFAATGTYTIFDCAVPCDTGMYDYCPGGSYGITNCICVGEAPILAPNGGGLASVNNTRYGWSATGSTSYNGGMNGNHSFKLSWLFLKALTGVKSWAESGTYAPMDAGEALLWAHNMHGTPYATAAWGLSGAQVTGQGDPLARLSPQYVRTWAPQGGSCEWSTNAANWTVEGKEGPQVFDVSRDVYLPLAGLRDQTFGISNEFTAATLGVAQDEGATLTLAGEGSFKTLRETVVTNGHVRWAAAGGAGRRGIRFVGARGNLYLPGNARRYFGEGFANVGTVEVSGGNVVIDTPRDFAFGNRKVSLADRLDYEEIAFVAADRADVTAYNQLRSRAPGIFRTDKRLPVVNSLLSLQTYNIGGTDAGNSAHPLIYATNATIRVQANPLWKEEYFVRPTYLSHSTIVGDYDKFAFGPADGTTGYDLYVSGACALSGDKPIRLNGELRVHFEGEGASLELANALCDGTAAGSVRFIGRGTVKVSATQNFTAPLEIPSGVTLEGAVAKLSTGTVVVRAGATAAFGLIPLEAVRTLTLEGGASVHLPGETAHGIYQVVDSAATALVDGGAAFYDVSSGTAERIEGDLSEGYLLRTANILYWRGADGAWSTSDSSVWTNASGGAGTYADGVPLCFADGASDTVTVTVGEAVAPGFMDFRNRTSAYVFEGTPAVSVPSLAVGSAVTFRAPLRLGNALKVTAGRTEVNDVETPSVEVAGTGALRVRGAMTVPAQKIRKIRFSFAAARDSGSVAAIQELRLYNADGFFYLPEGTVITDIAGQEIRITGRDASKQAHTWTSVKGSDGEESLRALVDGTLRDNNKWWASNQNAPTWFEIAFPTNVAAVTGYDFLTADSAGRNPKAWSVYTAADDGAYALSATKSDVAFGGTHQWMAGDGTAEGALYPLINANGFARVRAGGTLVLDGRLDVNLALEAGAVLAVEGQGCLTNGQALAGLTLPESGVVKIDLTAATKSNAPFPILRGYGLTSEQLAKFACTDDEGMLVVRDGDLYAATQSEKPPYRATVSADAKWSALGWRNANGAAFDWNAANRKPDGKVELTVTGTATVDVDVGETVGELQILGGGAVAFTTGLAEPLRPSVLDDSSHTGTLDWRLPTGSAAVSAGLDTCLRGGAAGGGLLTVGPGRKVTLGDGVTFADRAIDRAGWVRFEGARSGFELAGYDAATYSFADGELAGLFTLDGHTIRSRAGDRVRLVGTADNYYARALLNFDIAGGTVEVETNGDTTWFGRTATSGASAATVFSQCGGTFRCLATGTGAGGGLLTGYEGGNGAGEEFRIDLTGGSFEVPNSYLDFGNPTVVTLLTNAHLKAKGYLAAMSPGVISLGSNATDSVVMEVGALGLSAGAADVTMYNGSAIVGYEDGAFIEGGITLRGKNRNSTDEMVIAATNGTTVALRNLAFAFYVQEGAQAANNGKETVVFGRLDRGWDGTVSVASEACLPVSWKVGGGTVDLGRLRYASGATLKAAPAGTVRFTLTEEEYESGMAIDLLHVDAWVNGWTSGQLAERIRVYRENGAPADGSLSASNGTVSYIPAGGASEYVFPLTASVTADANWTALAWKDRNGQAYTGAWQNVKSAQLVNNAGTFTVTMDRTVSLLAMNTQVGANRKLTIADSGENRLRIETRFNDATSAGTTVPSIDLGQGFAVYAGKDLQLAGSLDASVGHGTLVIGSANKATVNGGYWNGAVEMADSTAVLHFSSGVAFGRVPCSLNPGSMGKVQYAASIDLAGEPAEFGSATSRAADGRFSLEGNASLVCSDLYVGRGNNSIVGFDLMRSSSLAFAKAGGDSEWVLADDVGTKVTTWIYPSANISADGTTLWVGRGGSATLHIGADLSVKGIVNDPVNSSASELLMYGKTLQVGSGGIRLTSSAKESFYASGTIRATADARIAVTPAIAISGLNLEAPTNVTLTVDAPIVRSIRESQWPPLNITGEGTVVLSGRCSFGGSVNLKAGTLRLSASGLLGNCPAVFGGGRMAVELTLEQVRAKVNNTYALFQTTNALERVQQYTTVLVKETGNTVGGTWRKSGNGVTFTPSDGGDITAEIAAGGTYDWTALGWRDGSGDVQPAAWESVVGNVLLTNRHDSTVTIARNVSLATLRLYNGGTLAVNGPFTADTVDDSRSTGRTVFGAGGAVGSVKAGADTVLGFSGTGTLTIESGRKATSRVAYAGGISIAGTGTYVYGYPVTSIGAFADDRRYAGGGTSGEATYGSGTLRLEGGEYVYGGKFAMTRASARIAGGTRVTAPRFVLGDGSGGNSAYEQTGGIFEVTGSTAPTSNQSTVLLGHWNSDVTMTVAGGAFVATNAAVRLGWDGRPAVTVGGGETQAVMRVKGIQSGGSSHNGTASFRLMDRGVLELGDHGLQASGTAASYVFAGGKVVAFADSSVRSAAADRISVSNSVVFAAEDGRTLTVEADFAGDGTIVCGEAGRAGTVLFVGGTYADATLAGAFTVRLTAQQQSSGAAVALCRTTNATADGVTVQLSDGSGAPGRVAVEDGRLVWTPPVCTMPLRATAEGNVAWGDLQWRDSSDPAIDVPKAYWSLLTNISVAVTVSEGAVLTMPPASQKLPDDLTVGGRGTVAVDGIWPTYKGLQDAETWQGTLRVANKTGCTGQNFAYLGNAESVVEVDNVGGWFAQESVTAQNPCGVTYPYVLRVAGGGLSVSNGSSWKGFAFARLVGDGPVSFGAAAGDPRIRLVLKDVSGYTGALTVLGKGAVSVGTPTGTIGDGTVAFWRGCVAPGRTWSAPNGVTVFGALTVTPGGARPFGCDVTFADGSSLDVAQEESACESVPLTTGALAMDVGRTALTFGGAPKAGTWTVAAGALVKTVEVAAAVGGFEMGARYDDKIVRASGAADGFLSIGSALHPVSFASVAGAPVVLRFGGTGSLSLAGGLDATAAKVVVDASGLAGEELAKNAVCGVPYSYWAICGAVTGTVEVAGLPNLPVGYRATPEVLPGHGVRFVVTAPDEAKFGAVSVNLRNGDALEATDVPSGLYPVARRAWGDLPVGGGRSVVVSNATFAIGSGASAYGVNGTPPDMLYKQYMDDSGTTRTLTLSGVPYERYRILVYYSTDTADCNFRPLRVNDDWYAGPVSAVSAATAAAASRTVKGRRETWGHSGPSHNANAPAEGVNVLATDVCSGDVTLGFTRDGGTGARATPCAIQVVRVGEVFAMPGVSYAADVTASTEWADGAGGGLETRDAWQNHANSTIRLTAKALDATVTFDTAVTAAELSVLSEAGRALTLRKGAAAFDVTRYDFSAAKGAVTNGFDTGSAAVVAGADTVLSEAGGGVLSVASGCRATLEKGWGGAYDVAAGAALRFEPALGAFAAMPSGAAVSYRNLDTAGAAGAYAWLLKVEDGDRVALRSNDHSFKMQVDGGELTLGTGAGEFLYGGVNGAGGNPNSVITVNGGRLVANVAGGTGTASGQRGLILGRTASGITQHPTVTVNGGEFDLSGGVLSPWEYGEVNLNGGVLKAKGVWKGGGNRSALSLAGGVLELGADGIGNRASGAFAVTLSGATVRAVDDSRVAPAVSVTRASVLAAEEGRTLTVAGALSGTGTLAIGADGASGTVVLAGENTLSGGLSVRSGTLRAAGAASLGTGAVSVSGGTLSAPLGALTNDLSVAAGAVLDLSHDGELSGTDYALTTGALTLDPAAAVRVNGRALPDGWQVDGNRIVFSGPTEPFTLTVSESGEVDWTAADWRDANGAPVPAARWEDPVSSASLVVGDGLSVTVRVDGAVGVATLAATGACTLDIPSGASLETSSPLASVTVTGAGSLTVRGNSLPACTGFAADTWTGTLTLAGYTQTAGGAKFASYANAGSRLVLTGWSASTWIAQNNPFAGTLEVVDDAGGLGWNSSNMSQSFVYAIARLAGEGTLENAFGTANRMVFADGSAFRGTLKTTGRLDFSFGDGAGAVARGDANGSIVVTEGQSATVAAGRTWTVSEAGDVKVYGTLTLESGASVAGGAVVLSGLNASVVVRTGCAVEPVLGMPMMDLAAAPEADGVRYTVVRKTLAAAPDGSAVVGADYDGADFLVAGAEGGYIAVDSARTPAKVTSAGDADVVLRFADAGRMALADGLDASACAVVVDASGLAATNLARFAVAGAPYSRWLVLGAVQGAANVSVTNVPNMPAGYAAEAQVLADYGVRIVVTAPDAARFGSVNVNFAGGRSVGASAEAKVSVGDEAARMHGAHPVPGACWNDLGASNTASSVALSAYDGTNGVWTAEGLGASVAKVSNAYTTGSDHTVPDRIFFGYCDDGGNGPQVTLANIPFAAYRIITYHSTDTKNARLGYLNVTAGGATESYRGPNGDGTGGATVRGAKAWGKSSDGGAGLALGEGVNYLVTDVLTGPGPVTIEIKKDSGRAGLAAFQVVRVGEVYAEGPSIDPGQQKAEDAPAIAVTDPEGKVAVVTDPTGTNTSVTVVGAGDYTIEVPAHIGYVGGVTDEAKVKVYGTYVTDEGLRTIDLTEVTTRTADAAGTAVALDPTASLRVDGKDIAVTPSLTDAQEDAIPPLVVSDDAIDLGVRTIPGLSYRVLEVSLSDGTATPVAATDGPASSANTQLRVEKGGKPSGFYRIEVYR